MWSSPSCSHGYGDGRSWHHSFWAGGGAGFGIGLRPWDIPPPFFALRHSATVHDPTAGATPSVLHRPTDSCRLGTPINHRNRRSSDEFAAGSNSWFNASSNDFRTEERRVGKEWRSRVQL